MPFNRITKFLLLIFFLFVIIIDFIFKTVYTNYKLCVYLLDISSLPPKPPEIALMKILREIRIREGYIDIMIYLLKNVKKNTSDEKIMII